ncbi:nitrite reductase large subunit NirB [Acidisphaera sp. S103]|uniref:nitrite reductase large subunit NirB n=1 Tax=Acidisphaera sp. S103 TaxID=1747223 RepID=UPI001C208D05|nr:nitrite reductase large subunit NirB [Acidisphaera sp. S103]
MIAPRRRRLVLVGNGMAGIRTLEEILSRAPHDFAITVFGAEPHGNYNRIMLSPVLAGEKTFEAITTHPRSWYEENGIELIAGEAVVGIDRDAKTVTGALGATRPYDTLLLATGSNPVIIPLPGHKLSGVIGFRDIADVETMMAASKSGTHAVVIGGGLLGLEAANGLALNGMDTTVLHIMPTLMERQLDPVSAAMLKADLATRGIKVITEANTKAILGEDRVEGVTLADGTHLPADIVVMAAGVRPNIALAKEAGLACGRGIQVDDGMLTSDPAIYAVGECVEHRGAVFGLVAPLFEMAKIVADRVTRSADSDYTPAVTGTRLKVTGIDMFSAGDFIGDENTDDIVFRDASRGVHKRLVVRDDKLVGAVLYGDAQDSAWYFDHIRNETDISALRDTLVFGPAPGNDNAAPGIESLPDTAEICGCNGVSKGAILNAIGSFGLTTVDQVRSRTKASASCGSCTCQVEALLTHALGSAYDATPKVAAVCPCTTVGHDAVRQAILSQTLRTIPAVMRAMGWTTPDGCARCRPALNYYLVCAWPGEYRDDSRSRFVNERMHANIQKDGTYSVVPRMWGGVTSAAELRAIADVVDKHRIPTVKVTGGQRIDLLGVRKEQLPAVWGDLNAAGMVSGHAYGKALRTVKTCVGSEWCRFGTQDSTAMGIALEKMTWGSWTPHKTKMAVSGCPRNCAEATIKDFGVIATESGWDLYVGGNGGIKVRVTDLLAKVSTEADVLEYAAAFMQLYREEAWYLERTAPWVERVGIEYVRSRLSDPNGRLLVRDRFMKSQQHMQADPWAERAASADAHEFRALAAVA